MRRTFVMTLLGCVVLATQRADGQVAIGLVSDFQSGTTQSWKTGPFSPNPPTVLHDGHGPGDHALQVYGSGTSGAGGRVVVFNVLQWAGDYLDAGVTSISMDLKNVGNTDLDIRLAVRGSGGRFATITVFSIPAGGEWASFVFPVDSAGWVSAGGANLNDTLTSVSELRILNSPAPAFIAIVESGDLLVDNITAHGMVCYADCDRSTGPGVLDIFDFLCFQNSFVNGETYACDCETTTGNGVCDVFDFLCFQDAFVSGCP